MLLNSCNFGRLKDMSEGRMCFEHCTLRNNCMAVNISSEGCQMCYLNELLDDQTQIDPGSSNIFVRKDNLGKITLII